jgi:2-polyprenyl-3-methyl-5-hydroxy-6-metoxy-1,4-benzoquinol methylase
MKITQQEWIDSQQHEASFWSGQVKGGNDEQFRRWGWYSGHCFPDYFRDRDFSNLHVADVGSGPRGILHYLQAARKVAVDPLMDQFKADGHQINENEVIACTAGVEAVGDIWPGKFDVVFCLNCLDHCRDVSLGMDQLAKMLKAGGELVICVDMRHPDDLDHLHKIRITDEFMRAELERLGMSYKAWHVPHQAPTRTVQFCAIGRAP